MTNEAQNPKHEIRNKFKMEKSQCSKHRAAFGVLNFGFLSLEFVSCFEFRISNFVPIRGSGGVTSGEWRNEPVDS
jgi:hypothetical protein